MPRTWRAGDGVDIAYEVAGNGPPVLLLHGFASDSETNWVRPGVVAALEQARMQVITYDARGHGRSGKPHDPAAYSGSAMVRDARGLIDHLGYEQVFLIGYSMGSQVAAGVAAIDARVERLVLGGTGPHLLLAGALRSSYPATEIAEALEADDPASIRAPVPKAYRAFADATGADRLALAAIQRARALAVSPDLEAIKVPVLVITGEKDTLAGDPHELVGPLMGSRVQIVPGDHISAVTNKAFVEALVEFLAAR